VTNRKRPCVTGRGTDIQCVSQLPGLIVLRIAGGLSREEQWAWVEPVVDWLLTTGEMLVNKAVVVTGKGKFQCVDLPHP
jgi:hypothetical protein